jgi:TolB-like protein
LRELPQGVIYRFNNCTLDTEKYLLSITDAPISIEPLAFDLLVYLLKNRERVVSREELLDKLWKGKVVTDSALGARLKDARKAVQDSGASQSVIKTIHGRGYQFVALVSDDFNLESESTVDSVVSGQPLEFPAKPSIAVLPLKNVSSDEVQEYFSDGITDGIIDNLTRYRELFVIGRSSSFSLRSEATESSEIGIKLGVRFLVQGSVRRLGNRVRILVELTDTITGQVLWSERYDRDLVDVFDVEDEVAKAIVLSLVDRVSDATYQESKRKSTEQLEAYDWVLRANRQLERGGKVDLLEARQMYHKAVEVDPECSAAFTGLSKVQIYLHWGLLSDDHQEAIRKALEFGKKAVELDDKDSRAHYAIGHAYFSLGLHEEAEFHVDKALALNPSEYHHKCAKGYLLACTGRHEESLACFSESLRQNPLAPNSCFCGIGISDYLAGEYEKAIIMLTRLSSDLPRKYSLLAASHAQQGNSVKAREAADEYRSLIDPALLSTLQNDETKWREHWANLFSILVEKDFEHLLDGLSKSGLPV